MSSSSSSTPQVLLLGLRRSGKTSLLSVLHKRLAPEDTLFLDNTSRATPTHLDIWKGVTIWDGINLATLLNERIEGIVGGGTKLRWTDVKGVVWVIDSQDDYLDSLSTLHNVILKAYAHNPGIHFHILLHKMDGLSEDYRDDTQTDVEKRIEDDLSDASSSFAFARGVEPPKDGAAGRSQLEEEEEEFQGNVDWEELERIAMEKRYGKATSSSPWPGESDLRLKKIPSSSNNNNSKTSNTASSRASSSSRPPRLRRRSSRTNQDTNQTYNLETDIHLTLHQTSIYDSSIFVAFSRLLNPLILSPPSMRSALCRLMDGLVDACEMEKAFLMHLPTRTWLLTDGGPFEKEEFQVVCDYLNFLTDIAGLFENVNRRKPAEEGETTKAAATMTRSGGKDTGATTRAAAEASLTSRDYTSSTLRLSPDLLLCFWQLDHALGLLAIVRSSPSPSAGVITSPSATTGASIPSVGGVGVGVGGVGAPSNGLGSTSSERRPIPSGGTGTAGASGGGGGAAGGGGGGTTTALLDCNVDVFRRAVVHGLGALSRGVEKEEVLRTFFPPVLGGGGGGETQVVEA